MATFWPTIRTQIGDTLTVTNPGTFMAGSRQLGFLMRRHYAYTLDNSNPR